MAPGKVELIEQLLFQSAEDSRKVAEAYAELDRMMAPRNPPRESSTHLAAMEQN